MEISATLASVAIGEADGKRTVTSLLKLANIDLLIEG
jgi:hypothetical protein